MSVYNTDCPLIYYNGVYIREITKFIPESTPIYDEMNNLMYVEHKITVEAFVTGQKDVREYMDSSVENDLYNAIPDYEASLLLGNPQKTDELSHLIKLRLLEARKELRIVGTGWGNTLIHAGTTGSLSLGNTFIADGDLQEKQRLGVDPLLGLGEAEFYSYPSATDGDEISSTFVDLNFGPQPSLYSFTPLGGRHSARIEWEIKFFTKECLLLKNQRGSGALGDILSFMYSAEYSLNENYLSTRTIRGKVKIANNTTFQDSTKAIANVDEIRDTLLLKFETPNFFRRLKQQFRLNESKSELSFDIQDIELESEEAFPSGVIDIDVEHSVQTKGVAFTSWTAEVNGTLTLMPGIPYSRAFAVMQEILRARIPGAWFPVGTDTAEETHNDWEDTAGGYNNTKSSSQTTNHISIPLLFKMKERLFKRSKKFTFSMQYRVVLNDPIQLWLATGFAGGIATQAGYKWEDWKDSINLDFDSRGYARYRDLQNDNITFVDICSREKSDPNEVAEIENQGESSFTNPLGIFGVSRDTNPRKTYEFFNVFNSTPSVDPYQNPPHKHEKKERIYSDDTTMQVYNKTVSSVLNGYPESQNGIPAEQVFYPEDGVLGYSKHGSSDFIRKRAGFGTVTIRQQNPTIYLEIIGFIERFWGASPAPLIKKYGGSPVELIEEDYVTETIDNSFDAPLYRTSYKQVYLIKGEINSGAFLGKGLISRDS